MTLSNKSRKGSAKSRRELAPCSVVDGGCDAPANSTVECWIKTECFACGQPVCANCSSVRAHAGYGRRRLCNGCQTDVDGDEARVLLRTYHRAGYPHVTLAGVRRHLAGEEVSLHPTPRKGRPPARQRSMVP